MFKSLLLDIDTRAKKVLHGLRVLVCGGRNYDDRGKVFSALNEIHQLRGISAIIEGGCRGADHWAEVWAIANRVEQIMVSANWDRHGKAAGPMRNQQMLDVHLPDLVVAFPGGKGTEDMVSRATKAGVPVLRVEE